MKITIDNHAGLGALDYTATLASNSPLKIKRKLNQPTECNFVSDCNATSLASPVHYGRVVVTADAGLVLFTGYIAQVPAPLLTGSGVSGDLFAM